MSTPTEPAGRVEHVLLVDDEEGLSFLLKRILGKQGYQVTSYTDPVTALEDFRSRPDAFDVVVTDLSMPGMSGIDLASRILERRPSLPLVMISGDFRSEDIESAHRAGIKHLVLKPNTIDELGTLLHRLLAGACA